MDSRKDQELERVKQPDNAHLVNLPSEIIVHIGSYLPKIKDLSSFNRTSWLTNSIFKQPLNESAYKILAQAVIDDDRFTMLKLLVFGNYPSLILFTPSKGIEIESQLTWQRFYLTENVLTIAAKRKQIEVLELLLSYCDYIKPTDNVDTAAAITEALSAWTFYEMKTNENGKEEIVIPKEYADYAQESIDVFKQESFPGSKLSKDTEVALVSSLFYKLLPKKPRKLDDYLDPELLLLAVYKAYATNFFSFKDNWDTFNDTWKWYCIRVFGLLQGVQIPETGEKICEGVNNGVYAEKINQRAHKLKDGKSFYRSSRDSCDEISSSYFVGTEGYASTGALGTSLNGGGNRGCVLTAVLELEKLCQAKAKRAKRAKSLVEKQKLCQEKARNFQNITRQSVSQHSTNHKRSRCVIS